MKKLLYFNGLGEPSTTRQKTRHEGAKERRMLFKPRGRRDDPVATMRSSVTVLPASIIGMANG
jgi:hypothetical protein